ncbi:MAG TPA: hypothetical protein VME40_16690 [Caulobacteraceae bacterium]|nr:hypothetical protein [Caulobacteraceae bacterium]
MSKLRNGMLSIAALGLTAAAGGATAQPAGPLVSDADAPAATLSTGVYDSATPVVAQPTAYFWGGRNYCWYDGGWHGPGWYWCGYAGRVGWGWGGPIGWHNWGWVGGRGYWVGGHWRGGHWGGGGGHWNGHGGGHGNGHGGQHGGGHWDHHP